MRSFRAIFAALVIAASIMATTLIFLKSLGGGISVGLLLALVIFAYIYDRRQAFSGLDAAEEEVATTSMALQRKVAMRQARAMSAREDGDIPSMVPPLKHH
jgi:hypothetical protein